MSFFDNKEEVLQIELTQYGKQILASGNFSPQYYSFFDEDIIYDYACCGLQEEQNDIQTRILEETPYLKVQTNFSSSVFNKLFGDKENNLLGLSLSSTDDSEKYAPAFHIEFKNTTIKNVDFNSNKWYNKFGSYIVPQIYLNEEIVEIIADSDYSRKQIEKNESITLPVKDDDTFVKVVYKDLIFDIFEENVENLIKNFDIEIHKIQDDKIEKLVFDPKNIENGVIIDDILYESTAVTQEMGPAMESPFAPGADSVTFSEKDKNKVSSYFNYSLDVIQQEEENMNKRLFIYDPTLFIDPGCR